MKVVLVFFLVFFYVNAQTNSKGRTVVHQCKAGTCGRFGSCIKKPFGARCQCQTGFMGPGCKRPCQDVYRSCDRWNEEKRCFWAKRFSAFFDDNCAATCQQCQEGDKKLETPLAPILEPLAWLVGRWSYKSTDGKRFPVSMNGPYEEELDFRATPVPQFDRPPLNVSVKAVSLEDSSDKQYEVGFITGKPFDEDTGFVELWKPEEGDDLLALELNSNTGINTIEEGVMKGTEIRFNATWTRVFPGMENLLFTSALRSYKLLGDVHFGDYLEENTEIIENNGKRITFRKVFKRIYDYLDINNL